MIGQPVVDERPSTGRRTAQIGEWSAAVGQPSPRHAKVLAKLRRPV